MLAYRFRNMIHLLEKSSNLVLVSVKSFRLLREIIFNFSMVQVAKTVTRKLFVILFDSTVYEAREHYVLLRYLVSRTFYVVNGWIENDVKTSI